MTGTDPNETARIPTPGDAAPDITPSPAGTPGTAGWSTRPPHPAAMPRRRPEPGRGRSSSVLVGVVILAVGLWLFADQTIGLDLPRISWSRLWPLVLIGVGVWVVFGSMRRRSR